MRQYLYRLLSNAFAETKRGVLISTPIMAKNMFYIWFCVLFTDG